MEFTLSDLSMIATKIIKAATERHSNSHATVIAFSGDLGAGKTTLVQEIARQLGVAHTLQSPTFVIYKKYSLIQEQLPWTILIHGDMYRLESANEILSLGWDELLADPKNLLCIEWPENIISEIPDDVFNVSLSYQGNSSRKIDF